MLQHASGRAGRLPGPPVGLKAPQAVHLLSNRGRSRFNPAGAGNGEELTMASLERDVAGSEVLQPQVLLSCSGGGLLMLSVIRGPWKD